MNRGPSLVMSDHDGDSTDPGPGPDKAVNGARWVCIHVECLCV